MKRKAGEFVELKEPWQVRARWLTEAEREDIHRQIDELVRGRK